MKHAALKEPIRVQGDLVPVLKNPQREKFALLGTQGLGPKANVRTWRSGHQIQIPLRKNVSKRDEEKKGTKPPRRKNTVERLLIHPILLSRPMSTAALKKTQETV